MAVKAKSELARISAIRELLDRGFGKPTQFLAGDSEIIPKDTTLEQLREDILIDFAASFPDLEIVPKKRLTVIAGTDEVAAEALAQMGARIILVARSKARAEATLTRLRGSRPNVTHSVYFADLARLAEMKGVAAEIANREPAIDVLINNAGALFGTRRLTEDGLEYTFALNHMCYFV